MGIDYIILLAWMVLILGFCKHRCTT